MKSAVLAMLILLVGSLLSPASPSEPAVDLQTAQAAEQREDWSAALAAYEYVYDSTNTDESTRKMLRQKFALLRSKVPPNQKACAWGCLEGRAFVFRELDFSWQDKQAGNNHARYRYRDDELERIRRGLKGFADRVWEFSDGSLRIQWT